MMQAALQRHALLLLTGAEWGQFFEVPINQLLSSTIVFLPGPCSIFNGQEIWWPGWRLTPDWRGFLVRPAFAASYIAHQSSPVERICQKPYSALIV
jgi:hypothetical protein